LGAASRQGEGLGWGSGGKGEGKGREGEVEGREREGPKLLMNQGPSEPWYASVCTPNPYTCLCSVFANVDYYD